MTVDVRYGNELLLTCTDETCGRRVVLTKAGDVVVLDQGDFFATHSAAVGPLSFDVSLG